MLIRRERADDIAGIAAVHRSAFGPHHPDDDLTELTGEPQADDGADPPEVDLVARLRSDPGWIPTLSMVAVEYRTVIGHVCLTRASIGPFPVLALGPIGVLAEHQGTGVGSALMHAVLGAADALDEPLVGLVGHLDYYPRFGFVPAARLGITPDDPSWVTHFQVRSLSAYDPRITGEFRYPEPFYEL
ncbi:GNAT family N-acetyltransferase [Nocardia sp. NPDC057030]|uniref:GNAT family N-acetyltransferase n=1 Tax=unclassified Nocardia TaxID=2637762 RepID=UPI00363F9814